MQAGLQGVKGWMGKGGEEGGLFPFIMFCFCYLANYNTCSSNRSTGTIDQLIYLKVERGGGSKRGGWEVRQGKRPGDGRGRGSNMSVQCLVDFKDKAYVTA